MQRLKSLATSFTTIALCCSFLSAQDDVTTGPPIEKERAQRPTRSAMKQTSRQPSNRAGNRRNFGHVAENPGLFLSSNIYQLLKYKSVRRELEIIEDQHQEVNNLWVKRAKERRERLLQAESEKQTEASSQKLITESIEADDLQDSDVLLPHQHERLRQIALQLKIQARGIYSTLIEPAVANQLELTVDQAKELRDSAAKLAKEYEDQVAKLKRKFRKKLISGLSSDQQEILNDMLGSEFRLHEDPADEYD